MKSYCKFCFFLLAVRGYIKTLFPVGNGKTEQADVISTEVIREKYNIFEKRSGADDEFIASIKVPSGCHWNEAEDKLFLLTGNLESGKGPVLQCHTKEKAWLNLKKESILRLCNVQV